MDVRILGEELELSVRGQRLTNDETDTTNNFRQKLPRDSNYFRLLPNNSDVLILNYPKFANIVQEGAKEYQKVIMLFNMSGCGLSNIVSMSVIW